MIALDGPSERIVKRLAEAPWNWATFFTARPGGEAANRRALLGFRLAERPRRPHQDLIDEVATADLVVMIAASGENAQAAGVIGEACGARRVMIHALVRGGEGASDEALAKTLAQLRPHAMMLVIANADEYIEDMRTALRA